MPRHPCPARSLPNINLNPPSRTITLQKPSSGRLVIEPQVQSRQLAPSKSQSHHANPLFRHYLFLPREMSSPRFFSNPIRYLRWVSFEKPAIFYSIIIGSLGPVLMVVVPPIRRRLGDGPREPIPLTYPSTHPLIVRFRRGREDG